MLMDENGLFRFCEEKPIWSCSSVTPSFYVEIQVFLVMNYQVQAGMGKIFHQRCNKSPHPLLSYR
jgi:hypothetical protein